MAKNKKIKLTKRQKLLLEYGITIGFLLIAFFMWNTFLIYPIKLFVVITHEMSHGLAAVLTGGKVESIVITSSLGGETHSREGIKFIIASAGYLGSLLFGVLLFIAGYKEKFRKFFSVLLAIIFILFAANYFEGNIGKIAALFFAAIFIIMPIYLPQTVNRYFYKLIGLISMLYVVIDIKEDLLTNVYRPSDAQYIAAITSTSATFWSILWFLISVVTIIFSVRWGLKQKG